MTKKHLFSIILVFFVVMLFVVSFGSDKHLFSISGFERNQMIVREEYFKKEIPRVYFRKIGNFYLTWGRFYMNKIDQKAATLPLAVLYLLIFL